MSQSTNLSSAPPVALPERPTWVRWHIVALLVSFSFMTWFNRESMSVAYVERIHDQFKVPAKSSTEQPAPKQAAISEEAIGFVQSAFLFAYMVCMTPGGWFNRPVRGLVGVGGHGARLPHCSVRSPVGPGVQCSSPRAWCCRCS